MGADAVGPVLVILLPVACLAGFLWWSNWSVDQDVKENQTRKICPQCGGKMTRVLNAYGWVASQYCAKCDPPDEFAVRNYDVRLHG